MSPEAEGRDVRADDLRFLAVVAETGRLTAAARTLGVDHTTVSRRLRALELALGARLLDRRQDGWELTTTGRAVVEHARAVRDAVILATSAASGREADALVGTIRVTAPDAFGTLFVVPAIARVRARHPGLNVELITGARELILRDSNFDLAITIGGPQGSTLFTERLCEYDSGFYGSDAYLDKHGDPASLEELNAHALVFFVDSLQRVRELDIERYVSKPLIRFSSTNIFAQLEAVRRGVGIGFLSKFVADTASGIRLVTAYVPPARVQVTLAARREAMRRKEVLVLREALHQEVRNRRDELIWAT
ncbi:LysR family transcriptional regulator [Actinoplanes friuliensis]|uniref:LysR family transcriptional regulator n=1 Tax=Actinoplanes friuliensis DSM 7358 TaxID=1246995 RepID=U5W818_9ACTN|nr:LysR family transcriptional regulator [Actinoplanes friuliensis]AGZ44115.1 LysR family transcriptional regulator [Actinoplanes friuliensis DSM 7358]